MSLSNSILNFKLKKGGRDSNDMDLSNAINLLFKKKKKRDPSA